jgi:hypothetical protein
MAKIFAEWQAYSTHDALYHPDTDTQLLQILGRNPRDMSMLSGQYPVEQHTAKLQFALPMQDLLGPNRRPMSHLPMLLGMRCHLHSQARLWKMRTVIDT